MWMQILLGSCSGNTDILYVLKIILHREIYPVLIES